MKFDYKSILSLTVGMLFSCVIAQASEESFEDEVVPTPTESFLGLVGGIHEENDAPKAYDVVMSEEFSDEFHIFNYATQEDYADGAYHRGFGERQDFVTLKGKPKVVDLGNGVLRVTWARAFKEDEGDRLFNFLYTAIEREIEDEIVPLVIEDAHVDEIEDEHIDEVKEDV